MSRRVRGSFNDDFFKDFDTSFARSQKTVFRAVGLGVLVWLAFWVAVIVAAVHFLAKVW